MGPASAVCGELGLPSLERGRSSAAGQSPVNNCIYSNKPGSKNNFPRCVQSPYSLPAMNRSGDPPCAEFPNSLPEKKELQIGIYQ